MSKLHELTAKEVIQKIASNEVSAKECIQAVFERIHTLEDKINAYVTLVEEEALIKLRRLTERSWRGNLLED